MDDALDMARKGVQGTMCGNDIKTPVELKREVERRIGGVHEWYDGVGEVGGYIVKEGAGEGCETSVGGAGDEAKKSRSPESGKENTCPQPAVDKIKEKKKVSAVRKTPITKQPSGKKPSASFRTSTRKKTTSTTASVPPTTTTITTTREEVEENAAHHAAATALLDLSFSSHDNHSPGPSFTSAVASSPLADTTTTPSTRGKKRVYESEAEAEAEAEAEDEDEANTTTSRPHKRAKILHFHPLPTFAREETAQEGFLKGVEYAVAHFKTCEMHIDGECGFEQLAGLTGFVRGELGLNARDCGTQMTGTRYADNAENGVAALESGRDLGVGVEKEGKAKTRAFWDVV
jgi:hypothetical protein